MIQFEHTIEIDRNPAGVFAFLQDIDRMPDWQAGVVAVSRADHGPVVAGTAFEATIKKGMTLAAHGRVVASRPDTLIAFAADASPMSFYCGFELTPNTSGGTHIVARYEFELHGLWKLMRPMSAAMLPRETAGELIVMKRLLERDAATPRQSHTQ